MAALTSLEEDELPIIERVRAYLNEQFGPIRSFTQVPSPHEHRAFYPVAFFDSSDGRQLVAKWHGKNAVKLATEHRVSKLLIAHKIPTTVPIHFNAEAPVLVMERLVGKPLRDNQLDTEAAAQIGTLLRSIHQIPLTGITAPEIPVWKGNNFADEMRLKFNERFKGSKDLLPKQFSPQLIEKTFEALLARSTWRGSRGLCRRDLHPENWFRLTDGRLAAIDHGNASVGDIAYDLVMINFELRSDPTLTQAFRAAYGPDVYDQATASPVKALIEFLQGLGMLYFIHKLGVPQPRFLAEAHAFLDSAISTMVDH